MKLLIVIVNYRTADLVIDCLRSLAPQVEQVDARVTVVDNASGQISVDQIRRAIVGERWNVWASVLPLEHNGGFAAGNNAAVRAAFQSGERPDHILLLNPDTVVRPGCLAAMLRFMEEHREVGILGPRLEELDGTPQPSARRLPTAWTELEAGARFGPLSRLLADRSMHLPLSHAPQRCDWVSGAAFLVRREVFEQVGLMDEGYFLYFEEIDFCARAIRAGWRVWHDPTGRVAHLEGQSTGVRDIPRRPAYWFASRRRWFVRKAGIAGLLLGDVVFAFARGTLVLRQLLHLGHRATGEPRWQVWDTLTSDVAAILRGRALREAVNHPSTTELINPASGLSPVPALGVARNQADTAATADASLAVVVIGRNEGERLHRCLESVIAPGRAVVYIDSGSTDASVVLARSMGVEVVELDPSQPFSAARARNAGFDRLRAVAPATELVQFIDGDCELLPGWLDAARVQLASNPRAAIVAGLLRERSPDASIYNQLCEWEWNVAAAGAAAREVDACGGVFVVRASDFAAVNGFDTSIVAGEEPELCHRLRQRGRPVVRIRTPMATHDAAMLRFSQWWRREVRNGYGAFDVATRFGRNDGFNAPFQHQVRSAALWSVGWLAIVAVAVLGAGFAFGVVGVAAALLWGIALPMVQGARVAVGARRRGASARLACAIGVLAMTAKWAHLVGQNRCRRDRAAGRGRRLIEYRSVSGSTAAIPMPAAQPARAREAA